MCLLCVFVCFLLTSAVYNLPFSVICSRPPLPQIPSSNVQNVIVWGLPADPIADVHHAHVTDFGGLVGGDQKMPGAHAARLPACPLCLWRALRWCSFSLFFSRDTHVCRCAPLYLLLPSPLFRRSAALIGIHHGFGTVHR